MYNYQVYLRTDAGIVVIATIENGRVYGLRAAAVETLLLENGWPEISPDRILHGMYCWAARVPADLSTSLAFDTTGLAR